MKAFTSTFLMLAACAAHSNPATHGGGGSGSDEEGVDAGIGVSDAGPPPPPPGTLYGTVLDERGDSIDFSTGEPVHTHAGPAIDLGTSGGDNGCPAVYKYAYLEDASDPTFGRQTTTNPLAWHVMSAVGSLDDSATAYRVRALDGTVLLDWTQTAPDANGLYTVELHRDAMPALGDHTGIMYVDVRFRDTMGNETVDSACWENHPLAAPLEVTQLASSSLFAMTLPAHSPISSVLNFGSAALGGTNWGGDIVSQELVQHTAEPVTVSLAMPLPTGTVTKTEVDMYVQQSSQSRVGCGTESFEVDCTVPKAPPATVPTASTAPQFAQYLLRVVDQASGTVICDSTTSGNAAPALASCTLPARGATEAPHVYSLVLSLAEDHVLAPTPIDLIQTYGEFSVGTTSYTGDEPTLAALNTCNIHDTLHNWCDVYTTWAHVIALDSGTTAFDPMTIAMTTAPDATAHPEAAPYVTNQMSVGALTWNLGDANF